MYSKNSEAANLSNIGFYDIADINNPKAFHVHKTREKLFLAMQNIALGVKELVSSVMSSRNNLEDYNQLVELLVTDLNKINDDLGLLAVHIEILEEVLVGNSYDTITDRLTAFQKGYVI